MHDLWVFVTNHALLAGAWCLAVVALLVVFVRQGRDGQWALSPPQAVQLINKEHAAILDLRSQADYAKGHIVGAHHVPASELSTYLAQKLNDKQKPLLFVCAGGMQSTAAYYQARKLGYQHAHRLKGGMQHWAQEGLPVRKSV